jgi:hypothetical protein
MHITAWTMILILGLILTSKAPKMTFPLSRNFWLFVEAQGHLTFQMTMTTLTMRN